MHYSTATHPTQNMGFLTMQFDPTLLESSDTILSKQVAPMYSASDLLSSPPPPYDIPRARTSPPRTPALVSPTPITPRMDYLTRGADVLSMWSPASLKGTTRSRATSQASIPHLREALNTLESKMASLMSERDALESNLAQAVRLQSPIQRLPCEILSSIFVVGVFQAEDEDPLMVSTLMLVCRYWAELAISTPQLWSNIVFSAHDSLEKARRKLQRSRACAIDVSLNFPPRSENSSGVTESVIHAMDLVRPALWRTKSFSLNVPNRPQAHAALLRCQEDAPLLESLSIRIYHSIQEDYYSNPILPLFNGNTPRLRSCSFTSFNFGWDIKLASRLRVLQLGGYWNGFSPSTTTLLHILSECPELEELSLRNLSDSDPETCSQYRAQPPPRRIHLPRLSKASFHFAGGTRVRAIFNHLSFPALQTLELGYCEEVTPVLERLKEQSLTSLPLRHLRIETSYFSELNFMNLLRRLKSLTSLELIDCEDASSHLFKGMASHSTVSTVCCPKLETLNLDGCTSLDWDSLRTFIECRLPGHHSALPRQLHGVSSASAYANARHGSLPPNFEVAIFSPKRLRSIDVTRCHQISKEMVQWLKVHVADVKCELSKGAWGEPLSS